MKRLLLLGSLALFAFTASAQSDAPACSEKEKTEKVCAKTGEKCSETCANKKTGTCCEGKKDGDKKACCSKDGEKKGCSKDGEKKACCSKDGEKKACCSKDADKKACSKDGEKKACCSKEGEKKSCAKSGEKSSCSKTCTKSGDAAPTKGAKKTQTKTVGMSK